MYIQIFSVEEPMKKIELKLKGTAQDDGLIGNGDIIIRVKGKFVSGKILVKEGVSFKEQYLSNGEVLLKNCKTGALSFYLNLDGKEIKFNDTELFSVELASFEDWLKRLFRTA